jgi:hypothetical protein
MEGSLMPSNEETRPVFQMCLALKEGIEYGYVFPSEVEDLQVSSVFTVPLKPGESWWDATKFPHRLPGMIAERLEDFLLHYVGEVFLLDAPQLPKPIRFAFYAPFDRFIHRGYPSIRAFPYIGNKQEVLGEFTHFVPLLSLDIYLMDEAYREKKMVFVGKTDVFPSS